MGLSEDQKAMLRLLAQREQGYEDIAALMGLSVEQVRERVKDALAQLEAEGKPTPPMTPGSPAGPVGETPGELSPAGPVVGGGPSSSQAAGEDPAPTPPAGGSAEEEAGEVPAASQEVPKEMPVSPSPGARGGRAAASGARPSFSLPKLPLPSGRGARAAIGAAAAVLIALVLLLVAIPGGESPNTTSGTSSSQGQEVSGGAKQVTKAVLNGVGGSSATGVAIFGRVKNTLALQVEAEGLSPTGQGQSYTVWLAQSPQKMLPLASTAVAKDGRIAAQLEVPTEVLAYLANEAFGQIVVTKTEDATLKASLKKATAEKQSPEYTGAAVLEGTVTGPIVGAAKQSGK